MKRCRGCLTVNDNRFRKCQACGKALPKPRPPKHMAALKQPYEVFVALNGGSEDCGACGKPPTEKRRNDRDHDHATGEPRGILCPACNRLLGAKVRGVTLESRIHGLVRYLDRHAERMAA